MKEAFGIVLTTAPGLREAKKLASTLVRERLAACVNLLPGARSLYRWQGKLHDEGEVLLIAKTRRSQRARLFRRLKEIHPYELPEMLFFSAEAGDPSYISWVFRETSPAQGRPKRGR